MARIRTIKPEFWSSPGVTEMNPWARLTFIAMWNWADDFGRGTYEPRELMGFVFPREDDMTVGEFRRHVGEIHRHVGVKFYTVSERPYFEISTWKRHQKTDPRLKQSKYPGPDEGTPIDPVSMQVINLNGEPHQHVDVLHPHVDVTHTHVGAGTGEQGNRGTGEQITTLVDSVESTDRVESEPTTPATEPKPKRRTYPDDFETFWKAYPKKQGKEAALKAWNQAKKKADPDTIIAGAHRYATDPNRVDAYTKNAQGWLHDGRWMDEPLPPREPAPANNTRPARFGTREALADWGAPSTQQPQPDPNLAGWYDGPSVLGDNNPFTNPNADPFANWNGTLIDHQEPQ